MAPWQGFMLVADQSSGLRSGPQKRYPGNLRLITYYDENGRCLTFMTNNFQLSAKTIAQIYKARWDIEVVL